MYKKILCIGVALIMSASLALAEYYIVNPDGDMFRARKVDKGYEPIEETPSLSLPMKGPGFIDTVSYGIGVGYYYPNRDSNTICIQLFNSDYACSLIAFGVDYYSEEWAEFYLWVGPDPIPDNTDGMLDWLYTTFDYDSANNNWAGMPEILYGPVPIGSDEPGEGNVRTCWVTFDAMIDVGTSAVFGGYRILTQHAAAGEPYGGKPWPLSDNVAEKYAPSRTYMFRVQDWPEDIRWWIPYGDITGDWRMFWVIDIYVNAPPSVTMERIPGTYSTDDRTVCITSFDFDPDPANAGVDPANAHLYYTIDEGAQQEATLTQDSVTTGVGQEKAWWHGVIPGAMGTITYWVEMADKAGLVTVVPEYSYAVKAGTPDYGLLYVEEDEAWDVMGIHNAYVGLPWDLWYEYFDGYADSTVTDFYITGPGAHAISWLTFSGYIFAEWTFDEAFSSFMDAGGCLFLAGQDVPGGGYDLGWGEWVVESPHPLADYLKVYAGTDDYIAKSPFSVFVDNTDVLTTGMSDEVEVNCDDIFQATWVGIFTDIDVGCVPLFFDGEGNILGYRYTTPGGFKVVHLYFPFHAITSTDDQDTFISNITSWFGLEVGAEENPEELVYNLPMVNPNPLSRSTTINFSIGKSEYVSVKIYDVTGSLVDKLVDKNLTAGTHTLTINTENLTSGVYFLKMDAGTFSGTRKFVVMK